MGEWVGEFDVCADGLDAAYGDGFAVGAGDVHACVAFVVVGGGGGEGAGEFEHGGFLSSGLKPPSTTLGGLLVS